MRSAVEAVAAHTVLGLIFLRHTIHIGLGRHGLMESRVEHSHLRHGGHHLFAGFNAHQVSRIVERSQRDALTDGSLHGIIDDNRGGKFLAAVQHTVTHSTDFVRRLDGALLRILQCLQHHFGCLYVVSYKGVDFHYLVAYGLLQVTAFRSLFLVFRNVDALYQTLCQYLFAVHVQQLVLQGGRTGIHDQNLHR